MEEPDYTKYSQEDLLDVLNHIDKEEHNERYLRVREIFDSRGGSGAIQTKNDYENSYFLAVLVCIIVTVLAGIRFGDHVGTIVFLVLLIALNYGYFRPKKKRWK